MVCEWWKFLYTFFDFLMECMKTGFLLIDKEKDWTSFDVCARLRKKLNIKKIGHTGTLDPFATGLLIVAIGKATKLIPFLRRIKRRMRRKFCWEKRLKRWIVSRRCGKVLMVARLRKKGLKRS